MQSEFDAIEDEPKDRTKLIWVSIVVLVALLGGSMWFKGEPKPVGSVVKAQHILISFDRTDADARRRAEETIKRLRAEILSGENSFEKLAREYSDDHESGMRGGHLDHAEKDTYAANFDKAVWEVPVGELSDIVHTQFGFHLIRVTYRHVSEVDKYEEALHEKALEELRAGPVPQE